MRKFNNFANFLENYETLTYIDLSNEIFTKYLIVKNNKVNTLTLAQSGSTGQIQQFNAPIETDQLLRELGFCENTK